MKRIHILQHEKFETPGCIDNWIKSKTYKRSVTELYAGDALPDVSDFDWLIIMGGAMGVYDTADFPWLVNEKIFIKEAISSGKVVLGICLGAQLIADVLGAGVYRNRAKEIGWFQVTLTVDGVNSSLLKSFHNEETVFHWHGDTFDVPEGALHYFTSNACSNQCFIYNERVMGLQFHLEVTKDLLKGMLVNCAHELVPSEFIQSSEEISEGAQYIKRNNELMCSILDELDKLSV